MQKERTKSIDLGKLQDQFLTDTAAYKAASRNLERAQQDFDTKASKLAASHAALKQASRTVLS